MKQAAARWFGLSRPTAPTALAGLHYRTRAIWAGRTTGWAGTTSGFAGAARQPYGGV